jgi:predicted 3-demethylubiquinone-9 3-methyltransferase (glyoxalase superfamily)
MIQKIKPFLWFEGQAEEAANFYVSIFKDSKITNISRFPEAAPGKPGAVMIVNFKLEGQEFIALNGGQLSSPKPFRSHLHSNPGRNRLLLNKLTADGGQESQCAWLKDKFGLSWQVVPVQLNELLSDPDKNKAQRSMQAMLQMKKIDIPALQRAAAGR